MIRTFARPPVSTAITVANKAAFEAMRLPYGTKTVNRLAYSDAIADGGTMWQIVGSEPSHPGKMQALSGEWAELIEKNVRPCAFGRPAYDYDEATWDPTGKEDASDAIDDAVEYMAATGAVIDHPGAIYIITRTITLTPLVSNNIGTLFVDGSTATLSLVETARPFFAVQGPAPTLIGDLTADIRLPANPFISGTGTVKNVLTLDSVTGLAVDDVVILTADYNLAGGNVTSYSTQPLRVMAIDTGALTVTTYEEPWNSYLVADNARVLKFDTRTQINITGELRIIGGGFRAQGNSGQFGVFGTYCYRNRINRITTIEVQHGAYSDWASLSTYGKFVDYRGCNAPAIDPVTDGANTAYPAGCAGSYDWYFETIFANRARHVFTNSIAPVSHGRWCGDNQRVDFVRGREMFGGIFDGHPGAGKTFVNKVEGSYAPGQADSGSAQVVISQGAGFQATTVRINGRTPSRAIAFEPYGWRIMTFDDPTDPAGVPRILYEPTAWVGSYMSEGGSSGPVVQLINYTNQSGTVSPQRVHLQIEHLDARGSSGLLADGRQGESHITVNGGRLVAYSDIVSANQYSTYPCSVRVNNTQLLYMGTSNAGINMDVDAPTSGFTAGLLSLTNCVYRTRRGQSVSANNCLVVLNNTPEIAVDADLVPTGITCTHTIANGGQVHSLNGFGYATPSSSSATQATSKATAVTVDKPAGVITMNAANLATGAIVSFTFNNLYAVSGDRLDIAHVSGGTMGCYSLWSTVATGSATIYVKNISAGDLAEAIVLSFELKKKTTLLAV